MEKISGAWIFFENKLLLIYHAEHKRWLPVGGHVENDETPAEAVLREVREEVGLNARIIGKFEEHQGDGVHGATTNQIHDFVLISKSKEILPLEEEINSFHWFSKEELADERLTPAVRALAKKAFLFLEKSA